MRAWFVHSGSLDRFLTYLSKIQKLKTSRVLDSLGRQGVDALASATPQDTGLAAASWGYEIKYDKESVTLAWTNHNVEGGFPVVIALQYGYATGTGGYVAGRDFINPAIRPVFDKLSSAIGKEVFSA